MTCKNHSTTKKGTQNPLIHLLTMTCKTHSTAKQCKQWHVKKKKHSITKKWHVKTTQPLNNVILESLNHKQRHAKPTQLLNNDMRNPLDL